MERQRICRRAKGFGQRPGKSVFRSCLHQQAVAGMTGFLGQGGEDSEDSTCFHRSIGPMPTSPGIFDAPRHQAQRAAPGRFAMEARACSSATNGSRSAVPLAVSRSTSIAQSGSEGSIL